MTVVLPHGAFFRKGAEGRIRKNLLEKDLLEAVIGLGPNIFYGTQLAACVMVFKQKRKTIKKGKFYLLMLQTRFVLAGLRISLNQIM
jgi:type I restriction enzyme M protein